MGYLYALRGVYFQEMKNGLDPGSAGYILIYNVPLAVVLAWIAGQGSSPVPLDYLAVGVFLMAIWNWVAIRTGWALSFEFVIGTFDYTLTSRTPLMLVVFGRALARTTVGIPSGAVPCLVILLMSPKLIEVANPALLLISLAVAIFQCIVSWLNLRPRVLAAAGAGGFLQRGTARWRGPGRVPLPGIFPVPGGGSLGPDSAHTVGDGCHYPLPAI